MNAPHPIRFTREDYHRIANSGVLDQHARVELIEGEIVRMSPKGAAHETCLSTLLRQLFAVLGEDWVIRCQSPVVIGDWSEPEPDLSIVAGPIDTYRDRHPYGSEVALAIEISDSSLEYDRTTKARLYAEAQIPNYWIFNLVDRCVEIHQQPERFADDLWGYRQVSRVTSQQVLELPIASFGKPIMLNIAFLVG